MEASRLSNTSVGRGSRSAPATRAGTAEAPHHAVSSSDLLETVDEFGQASLTLFAWEFAVPETAVAPIWERAIANGLIERVGTDGDDDQIFSLTARGRLLLQRARHQNDDNDDRYDRHEVHEEPEHLGLGSERIEHSGAGF